MKKLLLFVIVTFFLIWSESAAYASDGDVAVYVTDTGAKYHSAGCQYLSKSSYERTLQEAVSSGYTPCSRCHPPRMDAPLNTDAKNMIASGTAPTWKPVSTPRPTASYPKTTKEPVKQNVSYPDETHAAAISILGTCVICFGAVFFLYTRLDKKNSELRSLQKELKTKTGANELIAEKNISISAENSRLKSLNKQIEEQNKSLRKDLDAALEKIQELSSLEDEKKLFFQTEMPPYCFVGKDGLPTGPGDRKWGDSFTFYRSHSGAAYHDAYGCSSAFIPVNAAELGDLVPCKRCRPVRPDLSWYYKYLEIEKKITNHEPGTTATVSPVHGQLSFFRNTPS